MSERTIKRATRAIRIGMVAGEPSGDLLGALLIEGLRAQYPHIQIEGIGGDRMRAAGMRTHYDCSRLAVRGYAEVLRQLPGILWIRRNLARQWLADPPDLFVGIDAPDFNLPLERRLKDHGIPTLHFISPSIWAWRAQRIHAIREAIDEMLVVFPFEEALYRQAGIPVTYVGYPLAQHLPLKPDQAAARAALGLPEVGKVVALLPGSRRSELDYMAALFIETAALLAQREPEIEFIAPVLNDAARLQLEALAARHSIKLHCVLRRSHEVLCACDSALIASGTATLEAALLKRPMVIAYRMANLSWRIMRRQRRTRWIGLPNILCQEDLVPEFLQDEATAQALANALHDSLTLTARRTYLINRFSELHRSLIRDTSTLAANRVLALCTANHEIKR